MINSSFKLISRTRNLFLKSKNIKYFSTACFVSVIADESTNTAKIVLDHPPVNSLSLDVIQQLTQAIKSVEKKNYHGFILSSSSPTIFSAGLDLKELLNPDEKKFRPLWKAFVEMWKTLYLTPLITIAELNGHALAGGCLLAMSCDYRIMLQPRATIGIQGIKLGIVIPKWIQALMSQIIGMRNTEKALTMGSVFNADEALSLGLVDELAKDANDIQKRSQQIMNSFIAVPAKARQLTKLGMHQPLVDELRQYEDQELEEMLAYFQKEENITIVEQYMKKLKSKI